MHFYNSALACSVCAFGGESTSRVAHGAVVDLHCKFRRGDSALKFIRSVQTSKERRAYIHEVVWRLLAEGESKKYMNRRHVSLWLFRREPQLYSAPECLMKCDTIPASLAAGNTPINTFYFHWACVRRNVNHLKFEFRSVILNQLWRWCSSTIADFFTSHIVVDPGIKQCDLVFTEIFVFSITLKVNIQKYY